MSSIIPEKRPIIVFDLDGTLINEHGEIHPNDIALLTMPDPPALFVPATGRSLFALRRTFRATGIINGKPVPYPMILQNGALLFDREEKKLRYSAFERAIQEQLIEICEMKPEATFLLFGEDEIRLLHPTPFGLWETERYMFIPKEFSDSDPYFPMSKIMCLNDDANLLQEMTSLVHGYDIEVCLSTPTILEFNPSGITKGTGLEMLVQYYQWDKANIYCAGDGENDLDMFALFQNSFAPETSPVMIQNRAANIINTNKDGLFAPILDFASKN
jgi:Cof subfamily protein (haloacid dehalogenase superfamily)